MCGIAGYYGIQQINPDNISSCLSLMQRRGPNHLSEKHWELDTGKHVYFLHSRLNIIDLDHRSDQPFQVGSQWIVFNGELYNYRELKKDLICRNVFFHTESDTEVLLSALINDGITALDQCEGMWAFATYDEKTGILTLCRDRFGEKPLYILPESDGIFFGSEIKLIKALSGKDLTINENQIFRYLINGYKSLYKGKETFYSEIYEVQPSHLMKIFPDGKIHSYKYWSLSYQPDRSMDYLTAVFGVKERLIRSVELRLRADVPLAFCMSGGVDSNVLISIAKRIFNYDVHGFTIVNTDLRYDEQELVEYAIRELGIKHTSVPITSERFLKRLKELIQYHDAPVYTISYFIQWLLMDEIAKCGYHVSVSGTGADELFTGYYDHHLFFLKEIAENKSRFQSSLQEWKLHIQPLVRNPFLSDPYRFIQNPMFRDHIFLDADLFRSMLHTSWYEAFNEEVFTQDLLRNRMMNELFHEVIPVILHEDDLNAMYFSIENRSPFLDRQLCEFCYRIPTKYLIKNGMTKAILRDAVRGIVPDKILDNYRKVGFNAPIECFIHDFDSEIEDLRWIKKHDLSEICIKREPTATPIPNSMSKFIFNILNVALFYNEGIKNHENY